MRLIHVGDTVKCFGRARGMHRREYQVACFGSLQRDIHRLQVAHLSDQDDIRRLTQAHAAALH